MAAEKSRIKPYTVMRMMLLNVAARYLLPVIVIRFTSETAAGLMVPAAVVTFCAEGVFMLAVRKRVYRFVRIYFNNAFYINAKESSKTAVLKTLAVSIPAALVITPLARVLSEAVCGSVKGRLPLYVALVCAVMLGAESVLFGFAEGMGKKKTVLTLDLTRAVLTFAVSLPLALAGFRYGQKLDALLFTSDNASLYAVLFAFLGLLVTETVMLVLLLVVRVITLKSLSPLHETGKPRYLGEAPALYRSCGPFALVSMLPQFAALACCVFLCMAFLPEEGTGLTELCGSFFGRFVLPVSFAGLLAALPFIESSYKVPGLNDDIDTGEAGFRYRELIHRQSILCFPVGMFLTALADPVQSAVFSLPDETASLMTGTCSLAAAFVSFYVTFGLMLSLTKRRGRLVTGALLSGAALLACGFVLIVVIHAGAAGAAVSYLVSFLLFAIIASGGLNRLFMPPRGLFREEVIKPLVLSAVSALVIYLASSFLVHVIGETPTCIVCFFAGSLVYLSLMSFFRGFREGDLAAVPLGMLFTRISLRGSTREI